MCNAVAGWLESKRGFFVGERKSFGSIFASRSIQPFQPEETRTKNMLRSCGSFVRVCASLFESLCSKQLLVVFAVVCALLAFFNLSTSLSMHLLCVCLFSDYLQYL